LGNGSTKLLSAGVERGAYIKEGGEQRKGKRPGSDQTSPNPARRKRSKPRGGENYGLRVRRQGGASRSKGDWWYHGTAATSSGGTVEGKEDGHREKGETQIQKENRNRETQV